MKSWWMWLFACALAFVMQPSGAAGKADYLLRPDRVWNGTDDVSHAGWAVLVRDGAIVAVGPANGIDAGEAQVIDLPGTTLVPGLIDLHSHLFLHPYNETVWNDQVLKEAEGKVGAPVKITGFVRYALGEGIEKQESDFAAEVAAASGKK